jgi:plasmid stabilization system protein ParE
MPITLSTLAQESLLEILDYYETQVSEAFSDAIEERITKQISSLNGFERSIPKSHVFPGTRKLVISKLPYVAFIREVSEKEWEVVDIVHTSRKTPKSNWR